MNKEYKDHATIQLTVERTVNLTSESVYSSLKDTAEYAKWWPIPVKTLTKNVIQFSPVPFVSITLKQTRSIWGCNIDYDYIGGPFRGKGEWLLKSTNSNEYTGVSYIAYLIPINRLFRLVANTHIFARKHRADIHEIIAKLEQHTS